VECELYVKLWNCTDKNNFAKSSPVVMDVSASHTRCSEQYITHRRTYTLFWFSVLSINRYTRTAYCTKTAHFFQLLNRYQYFYTTNARLRDRSFHNIRSFTGGFYVHASMYNNSEQGFDDEWRDSPIAILSNAIITSNTVWYTFCVRNTIIKAHYNQYASLFNPNYSYQILNN
jgi:hypothetical protein